MVPHPYLLLACAVVLALAGWGGYRQGAETAGDACAADTARVAHAAAEAARATLRPSPRAGLARPAKWLRPPLQLVKPDCEGS